MHRRFLTSIACSLILFAACSAALAGLDPPHNETADPPIDCSDCHSWWPGWVVVPRGEEQQTVCLSCHNPLGQAPDLTDVANHVVNGGQTIIDCGSCHNPHLISTTTDTHPGGQTADNLRLIRWDTTRYVPQAVTPALFQQRPAHFSFTTAPYNGICQTCHTDTRHHTNDGVDPNHYAGATCTSCHLHIDGFLPTGGDCTDCHAVPQDNGDGVPPAGRRAVVGEFPVGDAHAHYGAELTGDACTVCHSLGTHMDGYVELIDPDDGFIYRFSLPGDLSSDPDISDFCQGCHDADGATRLDTPLDPFGNGNAPPNVAARFQGTLQWNEWYGDECFGSEGTERAVNSHHDISDADQAFSGAKIECLDCHGAHTASASQPVIDPFNPLTPWTGADNDFCLSCHGGGAGPTDPGFPPSVSGPTVPLRGIDSCDYQDAPWYVDYSWTHAAHGMDSKRGWPGYSGAPEYELACLDCHDPHGSATPANPEGNPYMIRDYVDGTMYVDDGTRTGGWYGPPWDTYGTAREVIVPVNGLQVGWGGPDGLCETCHAGWLQAYDFHSFCTGCQTCHGHGQAWQNNDFGDPPDDSTPCAPPQQLGNDDTLPLHFRALADSITEAVRTFFKEVKIGFQR
jgi:hypothetical protein